MEPFTHAQVHIADAPYSIDRPYTYLIPRGIRIRAGSLVYVPFGASNRRTRAIVTALLREKELEAGIRCKEILGVLSEELALDGDLLQVCTFLCEHTFCTVGEAARTLLPSAAFGKVREDGGSFSESVRPALSDAAMREAIAACRGEKQRAILELLLSCGEISYKQLSESVSGVRAPLKALEQKGLVVLERNAVLRDPFAGMQPEAPPDENRLSEEQQRAYETLCGLYESGEPKAALLHGVTGSGKTRVIKAMTDRVIASGRGVILMIPEISLTPQTVRYFRACYGERVAVMHSALSDGERLDMWRRIRRGEVDICIGTRSAVFAPFARIGMIVMDEEQEHTYKSDNDPKYHARDIARCRCASHKALMLLASATPSLESYYKAQRGVYTLIEMHSRYGNAQLPAVQIADLREDARDGNVSVIGSRLRARMTETLSRHEQAVLFLNRRGYNSYLICPICGQTIMCPQCSVAMTYHARRIGREDRGGYLACHWCGRRQALPESCPGCGNVHLRYQGMGTQRAEEELRQTYPDAVVMRMDADTTVSKFSYHNMLTDFREHRADILLGTQMVTKGHDFPGVTLSAVLSADSSLFVDDFRASERTFSMICQLLGRSGRAGAGGRAVIQTYNPEHPTIALAAAQDYRAFYDSEIAVRRALHFPPFCDIALVTLSAENEAELLEQTRALDDYLKKLLKETYPDIAMQLYGPFEAPVYRLSGRYRMRTVMKCLLNRRTRAFLREILLYGGRKECKKVHISLDVNPNNL